MHRPETNPHNSGTCVVFGASLALLLRRIKRHNYTFPTRYGRRLTETEEKLEKLEEDDLDNHRGRKYRKKIQQIHSGGSNLISERR